MVILKPGTALQGFIGVLIAVGGLFCYIQFKPFKEDASDWIGVTAQLSTFFVFQSALMIQVDAVHYRKALAQLLLLVTLVPPFIGFCWAGHAAYGSLQKLDKEKEKDDKEREEKEKKKSGSLSEKEGEQRWGSADPESSPTSPLAPGAPPQEDLEQPAAIDTD